jgi:hypothetical protein
LGVRQNRGRRGVGWDQMMRVWCLQAFVGKTDKFKRPFKGRSGCVILLTYEDGNSEKKRFLE